MDKIRLRFMDLLYAAVIGNALQLLRPTEIDNALLFGSFLIVVILEDFYLYYADVAPNNPGVEGINLFGLASEISVLTLWLFSFVAFAKGDWIFLYYLAGFFLVKSSAGFINCFHTKDVLTLKFARELLFILSAATLIYISEINHERNLYAAYDVLRVTAALWLAQTLAWWAMTRYINQYDKGGLEPATKASRLPGKRRAAKTKQA